jgi:N-acyl-D-amino-acid deacylase
MLDYLIRGGKVVDGSGEPGATGDVGVRDGLIVSVGSVDEPACEVLEADGALVTPGWVDVHTHYDGQVSWDDLMEPSAGNGVTTVVTGNCGVGFAPVRPGAERDLIELMEGVEDIPGTALYEGMEWGAWESFPDYLDYLSKREFALDVGTQIAHGPIRHYAMGERGAESEAATAADLVAMGDLVAAAVDAGALGFSTSRTIGHRSLWGAPVPGTFAAADELIAICRAMRTTGKGLFQMIPAGTVGYLDVFGGERYTLQQEIELVARVSREADCRATFTLVQSPDYPSDTWRELLTMVEEANRDGGAQLYPQVGSRPIGFVTGLSGYHAFQRRPTYIEIAEVPLKERAEMMADPAVRKAILSEHDVAVEEPGSMANVYRLFRAAAAGVFPLGDPVDYEPDPSSSLGARAAEEGRDVIDVMYDFLLEDEGTAMGSLSVADPHPAVEAIREMLLHPDTVTGLSDAGAHVSLICDGSMPSTQLSFWTRDRSRGERLPIELLVAKQTARNADLYGLSDRGVLAPGYRADLNVIDSENLSVLRPRAHADLPGGGSRLIQPVSGYVATMVNGVLTRRDDTDTGARPGRLVRSS